jgi:hypothetical protein
MPHRFAAADILARLTNQDFGFAANAGKTERAAAVLRWRSWWNDVKDRIAFDPTKKQFGVP